MPLDTSGNYDARYLSYSRIAVKEAKDISKERGRISTWADAGIVPKRGVVMAIS
jgi:hypothetical protein